MRSPEPLKKLKSLFSEAPAGAGSAILASVGLLNFGCLVVVVIDSIILGRTSDTPIVQMIQMATNAIAKPQPKIKPSRNLLSMAMVDR